MKRLRVVGLLQMLIATGFTYSMFFLGPFDFAIGAVVLGFGALSTLLFPKARVSRVLVGAGSLTLTPWAIFFLHGIRHNRDAVWFAGVVLLVALISNALAWYQFVKSRALLLPSET